MLHNFKHLTVLMVFMFASLITCKAQLVIHSGYQNGSYNKIANDLKKVAKKEAVPDTAKTSKSKSKIDTVSSELLKVKTSEGSIQNFRKLIKAGGNQMALMQHDVLTYQELADLRDGTHNTQDLRVLLTLGQEKIHLITYKGSKIEGLKDLKRKKVAIGTTNEGTHFTAKQMKKLTGINWQEIEIPVKEGFSALVKGEIDAFFLVGADPVYKLEFMSEEMKKYFKMVPIQDESLLVDYTMTTIKKGTYDWVKEDISTYGVNLLLVNRITYQTPEEDQLMQLFLNQVKENYEILSSTGHPNFKNVDFNLKNINKLKVSNATKVVFGVE